MSETVEKPVDECVVVEQATLDRISMRLEALERASSSRSGDALPSDPMPLPPQYIPCIVVSSSSAGTNQWLYDLAPVVGGGTENPSGTQRIGTTTYKGRNRWEDLDRAGYANTNVSALKPIPDDAPVDAYWSSKDGMMILLFAERNEPEC